MTKGPVRVVQVGGEDSGQLGRADGSSPRFNTRPPSPLSFAGEEDPFSNHAAHHAAVPVSVSVSVPSPFQLHQVVSPAAADGVMARRESLRQEDLDPAAPFAKRYRTEIAASTSSVFSTLSSFPLDSVKTRMQTYRFNSFWDCVIQTHHNEGIRGFWRGSLAPLASISMVRTISFSVYTSSLGFYKRGIRKIVGEDAARYQPGTLPGLSNLAQYFLSGGTAGAVVSVVACPFEFTKLSSQIEFLLKQSKAEGKEKEDFAKAYSKMKGAGTLESAKRIVDTRGFRGLYSGFHLHLIRDVLGTGFYFTMYETFKRTFSSQEGTSHLAIATSGGLCGLLSWAMIYPIDSSKSIYQRKILSTPPGQPVTSLKYPLFHRRMYRGLSVSMARSCLLNAIFFTSYEKIVRVIDSRED
ncbi:hypothetical protein Dda_0467 [Drechslerella dactyloides]|uniref:Mitochondrial carrier protein n=1 Tax=Drechslerella dactyloides TaxID=74499 RepID=A0AAD6NN27_DREDA|nr:hypothetical protein Dda_0467 [Drechslerella dactyloides]